MERLGEAGAEFRSLTEAIDTTTPAGRMMMQMVGAFAEFERAMLKERTKAGLDAAREEGRIGGRRPKLGTAVQDSSGDSQSAPRPVGINQQNQPCQIMRKDLHQIICKMTPPLNPVMVPNPLIANDIVQAARRAKRSVGPGSTPRESMLNV